MKTSFYVGRKARVYSEAVKDLVLLLKSALRAIILFCAVSYMAIGMMVLVSGDFYRDARDFSKLDLSSGRFNGKLFV